MTAETTQRPQPSAEELAVALKTLQDAGLKITADGNAEPAAPAPAGKKPLPVAAQIALTLFGLFIVIPGFFIAFFAVAIWLK